MFKKIVIICSIITIFCSTYSFGADSVFVENSLIESYNAKVENLSKRFELSVLNNSSTREKINAFFSAIINTSQL